MLTGNEERRLNKRYSIKESVSLDHCLTFDNCVGVCDVTDISSGGYSIKCLKSTLPDVWWADVVDSYGRRLKEFPVVKMWSTARSDSVFPIEAGVKFLSLTKLQKAELDVFIRGVSADTI